MANESIRSTSMSSEGNLTKEKAPEPIYDKLKFKKSLECLKHLGRQGDDPDLFLEGPDVLAELEENKDILVAGALSENVEDKDNISSLSLYIAEVLVSLHSVIKEGGLRHFSKNNKERLKQVVLYVLEHSLPAMQKYLRESKSFHYMNFTSFSHLLSSEQYDQRTAAIDFIKHNADKIFELPSSALGALVLIKYALRSKKSEYIDVAVSICTDFVHKDPLNERIGFILPELLRSDNKEVRERAKKLLEVVLRAYRLHPKKIIKAWKESTGKRMLTFAIEKNIPNMAALEKKYPGSVEILYEDFGIQSYAMYPIVLLLRQYEERNKNMPYMVIAMPFHRSVDFYESGKVFEKLSDELHNNGYALRAIEASEIEELTGRFSNMNHKYNNPNTVDETQKHKIENIILAAHGNSGGIFYGKSETRGIINTSNMEDIFINRIKPYCIENPTVIISSCKVAKKRRWFGGSGFARKFSKLLKARVIASKQKTQGFSEISVQQFHPLVLSAEFKGPGNATTYIDGELQNKL